MPAVVIATPPHRDAIRTVLVGHYFDLSRVESANDLIMVDAAEMLSRFMHDGMPDTKMFTDAMIPVIEQACRGRTDCVIRADGEMVNVLWQAGQTVAAIRLEMLWNQLAQTHSFVLLCGYSMDISTKTWASTRYSVSTHAWSPIPESAPRCTDQQSLAHRELPAVIGSGPSRARADSG